MKTIASTIICAMRQQQVLIHSTNTIVKQVSIGYLAALASAFTLASACSAQDSDGDGLPDQYEQQLLDTYRPWLYYDHDEPVWPCSATWFVQHSRLINNPSCADIPQSVLQNDPGIILKSGTWTSSTRHSSLKLDIDDSVRTGQFADNPALSVNVPIYGHVVPLTNSPQCSLLYPGFDRAFGNGYIVLQYWILFPYNDYHGFDRLEQWWTGLDDIGDHEGDWIWIDILLNSANGSPEYVVYHHHGDGNIPPSVVPWNEVEKRDGAPIVYLEKGVHEVWPHAGDGHGITTTLYDLFAGITHKADFLGLLDDLLDIDPGIAIEPHQGNGQQYRPNTVINLGEAGRPMTQTSPAAQLDCNIALLFNGEWGDFTGPSIPETSNPDSPVNQSWGEKLRFPIPAGANQVVWVDFNASYDPCTKPSGFFAFPYPTLAQGVSAADVGVTIAIKSSSSHEALTISKPMTVMAVGGTATIGQ